MVKAIRKKPEKPQKLFGFLLRNEEDAQNFWVFCFKKKQNRIKI
jgi:hypothetical protein